MLASGIRQGTMGEQAARVEERGNEGESKTTARERTLREKIEEAATCKRVNVILSKYANRLASSANHTRNRKVHAVYRVD